MRPAERGQEVVVYLVEIKGKAMPVIVALFGVAQHFKYVAELVGQAGDIELFYDGQQLFPDAGKEGAALDEMHGHAGQLFVLETELVLQFGILELDELFFFLVQFESVQVL